MIPLLQKRWPPAAEVQPLTGKLSELPRLIQTVEGFPEILASLEAGHSATIDGAWGSSCASTSGR